MKKLLIGAAGAVALTLALSGASSADPAVRIDDNFCGGFVPTEDGGFGPFMLTTEEHAVINSGGIQKIICHFDIPAGLEPAKATHAEGFLCGTFLGLTTDSKMVASPGGRATLTCIVKNN